GATVDVASLERRPLRPAADPSRRRTPAASGTAERARPRGRRGRRACRRGSAAAAAPGCGRPASIAAEPPGPLPVTTRGRRNLRAPIGIIEWRTKASEPDGVVAGLVEASGITPGPPELGIRGRV